MKSVNLSILVVNCKQYIPSYNWYYNKSGRYICGTANSADDICFNEARLKEFNYFNTHHTSGIILSGPDFLKRKDKIIEALNSEIQHGGMDRLAAIRKNKRTL